MTAQDMKALPVFGTTTSSGTTYLTLTYGQYAHTTGITVYVETSPDLINWSPLQLTTNQPNDNEYTEAPTGVTDPNGDPYMKIEVPMSGSREFIRLKVTSP
jgi:hypothetical protein